MRAAHDLDIRTVAVYSEDDSKSLHRTIADDAVALEGRGVPAYLNMDRIIEAAKESNCDAIHPGYGFLAENAAFARKCAENGIVFIGPDVEHLELFGDKARARALAAVTDVPILKGIDKSVSLEEAKEFFAVVGSDAGIMIKAVAGGGGRGARAVTDEADIEDAYNRCQSEANIAFGNGELYVEQFIEQARHIEVQILGDKNHEIVHLGERECSVQRRYQKIVEIAPSPHISESLRADIIEAALRLARAVNYSNLGTFEFLVNTNPGIGENPFFFIETNARLQVEHTVTEAVTGVDIVQAQIQLAQGESIADIGLDGPSISAPRGFAIQTRINMETLMADGTVRPAGGVLRSYEAPNGPGVRTDGFGYAGYTTSPSFDSLLAKVITHSPNPKFAKVVQKILRAFSDLCFLGIASFMDLV
ncbi:MAG: biotin carboxylase N-terminal domain-containing protein, partial [SAR202 cluster bacterium]|nr:biotin carboxylase N-terminal domain-containing protein [SAR202 cluster bacterium]